MIRTITVEEDVLKQQGANEENEKTSMKTSKLIGITYELINICFKTSKI